MNKLYHSLFKTNVLGKSFKLFRYEAISLSKSILDSGFVITQKMFGDVILVYNMIEALKEPFIDDSHIKKGPVIFTKAIVI